MQLIVVHPPLQIVVPPIPVMDVVDRGGQGNGCEILLNEVNSSATNTNDLRKYFIKQYLI